MKQKNRLSLFGVVFLAIGLLLLIFSVVSYNSHQRFLAAATETTARITQIQLIDSGEDVTHDVHIRFVTADGREVNGILGYYSSGMEEGDSVTVFYDPADPHSFQGDSGLLSLLLYCSLGLAFSAAGIYSIFSQVTAGRKCTGTPEIPG